MLFLLCFETAITLNLIHAIFNFIKKMNLSFVTIIQKTPRKVLFNNKMFKQNKILKQQTSFSKKKTHKEKTNKFKSKSKTNKKHQQITFNCKNMYNISEVLLLLLLFLGFCCFFLQEKVKTN